MLLSPHFSCMAYWELFKNGHCNHILFETITIDVDVAPMCGFLLA